MSFTSILIFLILIYMHIALFSQTC